MLRLFIHPGVRSSVIAVASAKTVWKSSCLHPPDRRKPQVISHKCKPENPSLAFSIGENEKRDRLREGQMQIPLKIRDCVLGDWTYGKIFLYSCEIPSDEEINIPKLVLSNQYHWGLRAINSGCTRLDYNELTDFLIHVNPNSTVS
jgi:hypothetical protein